MFSSKRLDIIEALGVNTRAQLAEVHQALQKRFFEKLMVDGVTIVDPSQTTIDLRATIGVETIIYPFTSISGPAVIGANCRIGPHAHIGSKAELPAGSVVGPFE